MDFIFWVQFILIVSLALSQLQWFLNSVSIFGATCVPLSLYVIPGFLFAKFHKGYSQKKYVLGMLFGIVGLVIIITYTAFVIYSFANIKSFSD